MCRLVVTASSTGPIWARMAIHAAVSASIIIVGAASPRDDRAGR